MIALDGAELAHAGYAGDTLLGYRAHFGYGMRPKVILRSVRPSAVHLTRRAPPPWQAL